MNNCIFTTHHTLTLDHAHKSIYSLLWEQYIDSTHQKVEWDNFIIYNTQPSVIDNDALIELVRLNDVHETVKNIMVFPYEDGAYPKTLTQDTINHFRILVENGLNEPGKTLLLKSDYCVSRGFVQAFMELPSNNLIWSLPIYNAKEKVTDGELLRLAEIGKFQPVLPDTYYRGGTNFPVTPGTMESPYDEQSPNGEKETHPSIRFVSHNIQNDYNLHVFSNDILETCLDICLQVYNLNSTWGGAHELFNVAFQHARIRKWPSIDAFGIHMYHGIISPNRNEDRTDPRKVIEGERY